MGLKADLHELLDSAEKKVQAAEGLAVSERNRLLDGFEHARSAVASSDVEAGPVEAPEPAAEATAPAEEPAQDQATAPVEEPAVKADAAPEPAQDQPEVQA